MVSRIVHQAVMIMTKPTQTDSGFDHTIKCCLFYPLLSRSRDRQWITDLTDTPDCRSFSTAVTPCSKVVGTELHPSVTLPHRAGATRQKACDAVLWVHIWRETGTQRRAVPSPLLGGCTSGCFKPHSRLSSRAAGSSTGRAGGYCPQIKPNQAHAY